MKQVMVLFLGSLMCAASVVMGDAIDNRWSTGNGSDSADSVRTTESLAILRGLYSEYRSDFEKTPVHIKDACGRYLRRVGTSEFNARRKGLLDPWDEVACADIAYALPLADKASTDTVIGCSLLAVNRSLSPGLRLRVLEVLRVAGKDDLVGDVLTTLSERYGKMDSEVDNAGERDVMIHAALSMAEPNDLASKTITDAISGPTPYMRDEALRHFRTFPMTRGKMQVAFLLMQRDRKLCKELLPCVGDKDPNWLRPHKDELRTIATDETVDSQTRAIAKGVLDRVK